MLRLRTSLQNVGLLRKYKGRLLPTRAALQMEGSPAALWDFLADRLIPSGKDRFTSEATLLLLLHVATSHGRPVAFQPIAAALTQLGWRAAQWPVDDHHMHQLPAWWCLQNVSPEPPPSDWWATDSNPVSEAAVALARDALVSHPPRG